MNDQNWCTVRLEYLQIKDQLASSQSEVLWITEELNIERKERLNTIEKIRNVRCSQDEQISNLAASLETAYNRSSMLENELANLKQTSFSIIAVKQTVPSPSPNTSSMTSAVVQSALHVEVVAMKFSRNQSPQESGGNARQRSYASSPMPSVGLIYPSHVQLSRNSPSRPPALYQQGFSPRDAFS